MAGQRFICRNPLGKLDCTAYGLAHFPSRALKWLLSACYPILADWPSEWECPSSPKGDYHARPVLDCLESAHAYGLVKAEAELVGILLSW
jgi:hypothetical protein